MNITLRKANAIQNAINDTIKGILFETSISINEFEDPVTKIQEANKRLHDADTRRAALLMSLFFIRGAVSSANASSGINAKLTEVAYLDKRIVQLSDMITEVQSDIKVIIGKLEKIKNRKEESHRIYGTRDEVTTGVMTEQQVEDIKNLIGNLKKQKQKLNDEILELNVRTEIELNEEISNVLQKENLI
jgi:hypothetical protein